MILNGTKVKVSVHLIKDEQEIKQFLNKIVDEVVDVKISAYPMVDNSPRYLLVVFVKDTDA